MHEAELLPPLVHHFESLGFRAVAEVPVAGRRADLVAVSDEGLVAVELKVSAWREALRQAVAYQVWASHAYVALPFPRAVRVSHHRDRFESEGVGLLAILGRDVRTFVSAAPSPRLFPALSDLVRRRLLPAVRLDAFPREPENVFMGRPA